MALTCEALTAGIVQSAVYDTVKTLALVLVGIGVTYAIPPLQRLTGATWFSALGWILLGLVIVSFAALLAYSAYVRPDSSQRLVHDLPLAGKVFVWRTKILDHDFTSDRPFVDFALDVFDGSLLAITIKAQEAVGYVKFAGTPLSARLEILKDVTVGSRCHGRLKARQWLSRTDVVRQSEWLTSERSQGFDEVLRFPGLPDGPTFDFWFSETRVKILAGEKEYPLSFTDDRASYYLTQKALERIKSGLGQETDLI